MEKYKLTLQRELGSMGMAVLITVLIDDVIETKMAARTKNTFEVDYKPTSIHFLVKQIGRTVVDQTITVNPNGFRDLTVRFYWSAKGGFSLNALLLRPSHEAIKYEVLYGERREAFPPENEAVRVVDSEATPQLEVNGQEQKGKYCIECGTKNVPEAKFCYNCGHKLIQ